MSNVKKVSLVYTASLHKKVSDLRVIIGFQEKELKILRKHATGTLTGRALLKEITKQRVRHFEDADKAQTA